MDLKKLGPNMTELEHADGTRVLYSYETPVAAFVPGRGFVKSERFYSRTTSAHVGKWLGEERAEKVTHEDMVALAEGR